MGGERRLGNAACKSDAAAKEMPALSQGFTVRREQLLRDLATKGREAGISVICAPDGFGKTALILQYVALVRDDAERGLAQIVDGNSQGADGLLRGLRDAEGELEPKCRPLIAIDNMPVLGPEGIEVISALLRELRSRGFELLVACRPNGRAFVRAMGDSFKVGAQALKVYPREYSAWARSFSIASELDVYGLTQGVPSLVVQLRAASRRRRVNEALAEGIVELYRCALEDLRRDRDPLYRLACLFILMGRGRISDFECGNMRIRSEALLRMAREYPMFGLNMEENTFFCLGGDSPLCDRLRKDIGKRRPAFALKAARILVDTGHVDRAVRLASLLLDTQGCLDIIGHNPVAFALSGNALFVHGTVSNLTGEDLLGISVSVELALYLVALTMGEYRLARSTCAELRRRANEIPRVISPEIWLEATALSELWADCANTELPNLPMSFTDKASSSKADLLRLHRKAYKRLIAGDGVVEPAVFPEFSEPSEELDVARLLLECDRLIDGALHGEIPDIDETNAQLQDMVETLSARHLVPLTARVRMTAATCRVLAGLPLVDERAFTDAGVVAIRESDTDTQLYCLLGEGWQSMDIGQVVNARFRAQQVLKLTEERQGFLRSWASMLERAACIMNTSKIGMCDEAELLDLTHGARDATEAWTTAMTLSAATFDSELSAWYSIHKAMLLESRFRPMARLALAAIGERANSIRRLLGDRMASRYMLGGERADDSKMPFEPEGLHDGIGIGQVDINLFGGFSVQRNGHTLTDEIWRRKRASVLAARLVLALGTFVGRQIISEEIWPDLEYPRARENLYVTASSLRAAFGQHGSGPQYVLTQADGLGLNTEYVSSDIIRFDMLARDILLRRTGTSARQIIESCLKIEQLYTGPLYAPDIGNPAFFLRMRRAYLLKFVDCMMRGIEAATEIDDFPSASWLVEAALRHAPMREDVVRCAMRIYDRAGRRREVVELYNGHLHYLSRELKTFPEEETRLAYESIVGKTELKAVL